MTRPVDVDEPDVRGGSHVETTTEAFINDAHLATLAKLIAGVAHELNTPLGAIHSNHDVIERALHKLRDILEDEVVTPDELRDVRKIVRAMDGVLKTNGIAVGRMVSLVESLGTFGRPDRAEVDLVDLHEGIDGTLAVLGHELKQVRVERQYGDLPLVECHPNRLNQVFMNLIHNAVQAMDPGGRLIVSTRADGDVVVIRIADTGKGIAPADIGRIFQPGFTTKERRVGMGLGLAISKQIIDHHGGTISAESTLGAGTTFTVRLPVKLPSSVGR
jgi:signal transduction histidine kinase